MIEYNATVLKRYADGLYSRSYVLIVVFTMLGAAIGFVVAFGLWNFTNLVRLGYLTQGGKWAIVVVLTVLGLAIGAARGFVRETRERADRHDLLLKFLGFIVGGVVVAVIAYYVIRLISSASTGPPAP